MGRRRKHGIIDNLDPAVKSTVEEMILSAQFTYRDIVEYITDTTGQTAVCRYFVSYIPSFHAFSQFYNLS